MKYVYDDVRNNILSRIDEINLSTEVKIKITLTDDNYNLVLLNKIYEKYNNQSKLDYYLEKGFVRSMLKEGEISEKLTISDLENKLRNYKLCQFEINYDETEGIKKNDKVSGIYVWFNKKKQEIYIGRAIDIVKRFSHTNYGSISPRNIFRGGQSTNVKMNNYMAENFNNIEIYFYKAKDGKYREAESKLLISEELAKSGLAKLNTQNSAT